MLVLVVLPDQPKWKQQVETGILMVDMYIMFFFNPNGSGPDAPYPYPGSDGLVVTSPGTCDI